MLRSAVRLRGGLAFAFGMAVAAAACGGGGGGDTDGSSGGDTTTTRPPPIERGGTVSFGVESDLADLRPGFAAQPSDIVIGLGIFDPLMTYNDQNELEPNLAASLESSEDLVTWTITLRSGISFHDGTPLNAAAVVSHFDYLKDPASNCQCQENAALIGTTETPDGPDGLTVVFGLTEPSVAFGSYLAGSSGWIESPTAREGLGEEFRRQPVGTGAFELSEFSPGNRYVLSRFDDYWKQDESRNALPYSDSVIFRPIPDGAQRIAALEAGDIDMFQTAGADDVKEAIDKGYSAQEITGSSSTIILMNESKPPFDDVRARQALAYAIDNEAINQRTNDGVQVPAYSLFAPDSPYFNPDGQFPKHDADKASELVEELGGLEFTIECISTEGSRQLLALIEQLGEEVGMKITTRTQDQGAYVSRLFSKGGDYEAACFRSSHFIEPDAIRDDLTTDDPSNLTFYSNADVDRLLDEGRSTTDVAQRTATYFEVQDIIGREVPQITITYDLFGNVYDSSKVGPPPAPEPNSLGAVMPAYFYRVDG